ncbi:MAG: fumarate hydratase C-terminal domain-containing protein [Nitrolancea sp.]
MASDSGDTDFEDAVRLTTPLSETTVRGLHAGDLVVIDGIIWGIRDATLIHIFDRDREPAADLRGSVLLHVAPSVRKRSDGGYDPVSVGTTTSSRMDRFTRGCIEELGARAIVGKGGLSANSLAELQELGGVYMTVTGGAASVETLQVEEIEEVIFEDLMPECLWKFRVKDFGPLVVTMDSHGNSLYQDVRQKAERNVKDAYARLNLGE